MRATLANGMVVYGTAIDARLYWYVSFWRVLGGSQPTVAAAFLSPQAASAARFVLSSITCTASVLASSLRYYRLVTYATIGWQLALLSAVA